MCGFCGAASADSSIPLDEKRMIEMRDVMFHRGPDDGGTYFAKGIALGSRRLSIVDLSERGHMPMRTADGRYVIAYNGEVYNYRALRTELETRGRSFVSNTDTEVVLQGWAEHGVDFLHRCNGMFAFAVWDQNERTLTLGRDRLGIKPVYYAIHNGTLLFASEIKGLFAAGLPREFDPEVWPELLMFRFVAGERTVFKNVRRLLPGHIAVWKDGQLTTRRWWNLADRAAHLRETPIAEHDFERWYRDMFDDSIALRQISDVPLGVMLSGGLDSSAVAAALALQAGKGVESFTVTFDEPGFDEGPLARQVARKWGLTEHEIKLSPHGLLGRMHRASWLNDEPLVHTNDAHMLALSEYAKPRVTVLLSGEGADETLNGYVRYQPLRFARGFGLGRRAFDAFPEGLLAHGRAYRVRKLKRMLGAGEEAPVLFNACDVLPEDLVALGFDGDTDLSYRQTMLREAKRAYPNEALRQAMYLDQHTFLCSLLDRNDRMTMGASIECRVPFLDYRLVERVASLPTAMLLKGFQRKAILRRSLGKRLPRDVLRGRKWGFGVPWSTYMRTDPTFRDLLSRIPDSEPIRQSPFDRARMREWIAAFEAGDETKASLVKELAMVAMWHDAWTSESSSTVTRARAAGRTPVASLVSESET